ncbi:hypothetical protein H7I93_05850 [Mycobacterium nebraskense]|nr:hypothetical protein [Mycobacterium nebraskense]MCV7116780.1 hypothetical protein [Mycobacterium nebraskense]
MVERRDEMLLVAAPGGEFGCAAYRLRDVAVIGLPDQEWGEITCAIVVADQSEVSTRRITPGSARSA